MSARPPTMGLGPAPGDRGPSRGRAAVLRAASKPWAFILVAALVLFTLWALSTRRQSHEIRAAFPSAVSVVPGLDVQANGVDVGKITSVDYSDGQAILGIGIDDEELWPLHRGTTATLRYGTTAGNGTRRIDLVPGPRSAPEIGDGGIISARYTGTPVEFDDVFRTMDRGARADMRSLVRRTAATLEGRAGTLNEAVRQTAPGLEAAGGLLGDLAADEQALKGVIANTHRATRTMAARAPQITGLVTVASQTLQTFAANTQEVAESIREAPGTLDDARGTLARLDTSVGTLGTLVRDASPGAAALPGLVDDARPAVAQLAATAPRLTRLLRTGRAAAPDITDLLTEGAPFARRLAPILADLAPMLGCLRPYAPELAGFVSNWSGFASNYDGVGHFARINLLGGPTSVTVTPQLKTKDVARLFHYKYAFPRPPGYNGGKPWLLPECGVGADALNPAKDPEGS
jgi:virulence factor Mce-like protein